MKHTRPILLFIAAIAIALVALAIERPERSRVDEGSDATFSPGFDSADVEHMEISQLVYGAELKRDGDGWHVRSMTTPLREQIVIREKNASDEERWHQADRTRVNSALGSFGGLGKGIVVSTNETKRGLYQVDVGGLRVKLVGKDGTIVEDVVIGKNGPDLGSTYLRRFASGDVVLVRRPLLGVFSPKAEDWRERRLWSLAPDDIVALSVNAKDGSFVAKKLDDGTWIDADDEQAALDQDGFKTVIAKLSDMRAEGFEENAPHQPLPSSLTLHIERRAGKPLELMIGPRNANGTYPAQLAGVNETYLLSAQSVGAIPTRLPLHASEKSLTK
jgi:hypothetical protein